MLAWSFDAANNPVEAEYIIAEKAPGIRLGSVWSQWTRKAKLNITKQVVDLENTLTAVPFPMQGCIYFKDDLRSLAGKAEDIHVDSPTPGSLDRFSVGPLTTQELWGNSREDMKLDRGPCEQIYVRYTTCVRLLTILGRARPAGLHTSARTK